MTPLQPKVLDFYRETITKAGYCPSMQEVASHAGLYSKSTVHRTVQALIEQGHLRRAPGKVRSLELTEAVDLRHVDTMALQAELARRGVVPGALARSEQTNFSRKHKSYAAHGCYTQVRPGHAFCLTHWRRISEPAQQRLLETHRVARLTGAADDVNAYQDAFGVALDEATTAMREVF